MRINVKHTYHFNFYFCKIKYKIPEANSEPTHFLTLMKNGKTFSTIDDIWHAVTSALTSFSFYQDSGKPKGIGFLETLKNPILLEIILIMPGII